MGASTKEVAVCQTVRSAGRFPSDERRKALIAARCCGPRTLHTRSEAASRNELATGIAASDPSIGELNSLLLSVMDESDSLPPSAKCAALANAAIDRALSLPPLVAIGPDSTDRTAAFRGGVA